VDAPADGIYMPAAVKTGAVPSPPGPIRPTPYYFSVLIERAKHLAGLAQQMEAAYLAALEKFDAESYNLLRARHDLELAGKSVDLQSLRVNQAVEGAVLALRQQERVAVQKSAYDTWLQKPVSDLEQRQLTTYRNIAATQGSIAGIDASLSILQAWTALATGGAGAIFGGMVNLAFGSVLNAAKTDAASRLANQQADAQIYGQQASIERRTQEWQLQQALAAQDEQISEQQITIARANETIAVEEQQIASLQQQHALAVVSFLASKFTSAELYAWMSGVLGQVYRYFLQQATSVARLAEQQLMFERQQALAPMIQADYWEPPSDTSAAASPGQPDRRGITGSARLLQDIYELDQFAFESNKRKLQLSQTLSLAQLFPQEFEEFRRTGRLVFATPMSLFDRAFPGHYLRLIRRLRTSVVALVPPTAGIRATLTNSGLSRVVIGGDVFHNVEIRREPETIALTSPVNATGVFDLDVQSDMMQPFEARGVQSNWELVMPKAANPFDYASIADVLITIDYTALHSETYRTEVIGSLARSIEAERAFSFRNHFVDAWYALTNAEPGAPLSVSLEIDRGTLPPHLANVRLRHVALYFARRDGDAREVTVAALVAPNAAIVAQPPATSQDGLITTRRANGAGWQSLMGSDPVGQWKLTLADAAPTRELLTNGAIEDLILLLTYSAETPAWV
jgi:Tc toxin complex TcA C-terminal TcB-binding domain